jgi:hypothetical protein
METKYKNKYLIYKTKYLLLKKNKQQGGNIRDIYQYLEENFVQINQINPDLVGTLHKYANSFTNPNITLDDFIYYAQKHYNISLPRIRMQPPRNIEDEPPARRVAAGRDDNIIVYTTGIAYFEDHNRSKIDYVKALIDNIVEICREAGKRVRFIHYDIFTNLSPRYGVDEQFIGSYLTPEIIEHDINNKPNVLLVDLAHIIHYYNRNVQRYPKPFIIYSSGRVLPDINQKDIRSLNINSFYPGYLGDMESIEFIRHFKFFQFKNNEIVTYIQQGIERQIKLRSIYKGSYTTFCDFRSPLIDISGYLANYNLVSELNNLFWL